MILFYLFFVFIFGLIIGSFLSAFSYRLPKNISVAKGRSFCPNCKKMIAWYDNIPLVSYILLLGKCRNCRSRISLRYPLIELFTAVGFLAFFWRFSPNYILIFYGLLVYSVLILIFVIDLEHQIIPDNIIFFGILAGFLFLLLSNSGTLFSSVFAGFLAASLLMLIHLATLGRGMGLGDVKFAVLGGIITGMNLFLVWLFASFLTGGIAGIILILGRHAGFKDKIAFGPFLVIGLILTIFFGKIFVSYTGF